MCIKYYAASVEKTSDRNVSVVVKDELKEEEFENLVSAAGFLKYIAPAKMAHEIALRNGRELLSFLSEKNLKYELLQKKRDERDFTLDANRLIYNFCASMRTFVDYTTTAVKRKGKEKDFGLFIRQVYDESIEYRFFYKLRNYTVHYSYPFSGVIMEAPDTVQMICKKEHLLEFDGWGAIVKTDLMSMPEIIEIRKYIEPLLVRLESINLMMYYFYARDYCETSTMYSDFQKKYGLKEPTLMSVEGEFNGKKTIHPLPLRSVVEGVKVLQANPYVNLIISDGEE